MSQNRNPNGNNENDFENNTIIENETTPNQKIIKRMNNSTRINIKNGLVELQRKTKEWITLKNNNKENSPYDLLRKDFLKLDNYLGKINSLKNSLNQDENLKNLKNNLLAYYVTYNQALTLMNQYETYLTPKNNNNESELQKLENLINTTSQNFSNNTQSFKDRFVKLKELLLSNYNSFKESFEKHKNYYDIGFGQACIVLRNYYIALIENFEKEVQNFNSSAANILKKLLELVQTIENNPINLDNIKNKYKNLFQNNNRILKKLFENLSIKSENNLIKNKRNIKSIKNLLNRPLKIGQSSVELKDIITLPNIPNTIPINKVNNNITNVLTYYNTKLAKRITDINNLLVKYEELCKQLKESIEITKKSKTASSDLKQINRIQNQVDAIMEQYTQLKTIGNNCKNLGNNILNLSGKTTQNNRNTTEASMVDPKKIKFGNFRNGEIESITGQRPNVNAQQIPIEPIEIGNSNNEENSSSLPTQKPTTPNIETRNMFIKKLRKEYSNFKKNEKTNLTQLPNKATELAKRLEAWNKQHQSNTNNSYGRIYKKNQMTPQIERYKKLLKLN